MPAWFLGGSGWQGGLCWAGEGVFGHCVCENGSIAVSRRHFTPRGCKPSPIPPQKDAPCLLLEQPVGEDAVRG